MSSFGDAEEGKNKKEGGCYKDICVGVIWLPVYRGEMTVTAVQRFCSIVVMVTVRYRHFSSSFGAGGCF